MSAPEPDFYMALMAAVSGGIGLLAEPRESTVQKWLYWAVAVVCISLALKSVLAGLGLGAFVLLFLAMMYLRYKL
ncbi:hypothetical protein ABQE45_08625 [Mycobacteroides chelonae]